MDPKRSNHPQRQLPGAKQPKTNAPAQHPRPSTPIPPVKWANNTAAVQRQPVASTQTNRPTVPIPSVRMPHSHPIASSIQRMGEDDDFEVPQAYRPRPLPTLWDWIEGPLRRREEYERNYPTQVATITDIPVAVPQQVVVVPGHVPQPQPQHVARVPRIVTIETLLKKGASDELSTALKSKYGEELGREMSRQMKIKPTTSKSALKKQAETKIRQRGESQYESEGKSTGSGSRGLNVKGKQVSNIQHGTGGGFRAGVPSLWHVHFDHVKWGTSQNTRINFTGRTKQAILADFNSLQPAATSANRPSWDTCHQWMLANL